jgi:hypothetical protein
MIIAQQDLTVAKGDFKLGKEWAIAYEAANAIDNELFVQIWKRNSCWRVSHACPVASSLRRTVSPRRFTVSRPHSPAAEPPSRSARGQPLVQSIVEICKNGWPVLPS